MTLHTVACLRRRLRSLKIKAAAAGELEVLTHDEAFKTLFALIGQKKMSQAKGEVHAHMHYTLSEVLQGTRWMSLNKDQPAGTVSVQLLRLPL